MINWDDYKYDEEICLRIQNEGSVDEVVVKLLEYGWHAHGRIRITAIVEIVKSSDESKWHLGAKMELPIKTDGVISFIMLEHTNYIPRHKTIHTGEIVALCSIPKVKKLPDSFVVDRYKKTYPTEIGSQTFVPDEIELFKIEKTNKLKHHFVSKFEEIKNEYAKMMEAINLNERLYSSKYNFQPIVGQAYYLYEKEDGDFLSIISPTEWGNKFTYVGSYMLQTDGMWVNC